MDAFIVKEHFGKLILSGEKDLEIRNKKTLKRGTVGVVFSGTSKVFGLIDIVDCIEISDKDFSKLTNRHKIFTNRSNIPYKKIYGWVLKNPRIFKEPIPYNHKLGCVIWVKIDDKHLFENNTL